MIKIYFINIENISEDIEKELMTLVSNEKQKKLNLFIFRDDRLRSLCGEILARYMIVTNTLIKNNEIRFYKSGHGKPYLFESNFRFNISHSGKWAVCAGGYVKELGVDIEKITDVDLSIAYQNFTAKEIYDMEKERVYGKHFHFFKLWTLKESFLKCVGKGLSLPLNSIEFQITQNKILSNKSEYEFSSFSMEDKYILSLCSSEKTGIELLEFKDISEFYRLKE